MVDDMSQLTFTTSADRKTDAAAMMGAFAFTGSDKTLPMLMAVRLRWDGAVMTMTATDRYALGVFRLQLEKDLDVPAEPFEVLIDRADVKRVAQMLKAPTRITIGATFTVDTVAGTVEVTDWDSSSVRFRTVAANFPHVDTLLPSDLHGGTGDAWGMSPANLTRLASAVADKRDVPAVIPGTSPTKPVRWVTSIGYGLLMPIRLPDRRLALPSWAGAPAATSAAA